jgi:hypothetical protein
MESRTAYETKSIVYTQVISNVKQRPGLDEHDMAAMAEGDACRRHHKSPFARRSRKNGRTLDRSKV